MRNRKKLISAIFTAALLSILTAVSIAGCGKEEKKQLNKRTNLVLWYYWDLSYQRHQLAVIVEQFNQSQEQVFLSTKYIPDADFKKELMLSIADGDAPDIALVDSADFQYINAEQPFVDLTDSIDELDAYMPVALEPCTVEGRVMGLPCGLNCTALFYNKSILAAAGLTVPQNWEDLYQTARLLTTAQVYGYGQSALRSEESLYAFLPLLWSMGGDVDTIDSENSKQAFTLLKELAQCGAMNRQSISLTLSDLAGQFAKGNVAMMINGMGMVDFIREQNPSIDFGIADIPERGFNVSVVGGEIFAVFPGDNQGDAVGFLRFISEKNRLSSYIDKLDMLSPREDVLSGQFADEPIMRQFADIFKAAKTREFSKAWPDVSAVISKAIEEVIVGERDMELVLNEAAASIRAIREESR